MTSLTVGQIQSANAVTPIVRVEDGNYFASPGSIIQTNYARTDARNIYAAPISGNGTPVTDLNLTITPRRADSLLLLRWVINGEMHYDSVIVLQCDGQIISQYGYEGYNNTAGNQRWSGYSTVQYDVGDQSTTPFHTFIQFAIPAGSTMTRTYTPAVRSSSAAAYTLYLNRCVTNAGADTLEVLISTAVAMEIVQ